MSEVKSHQKRPRKPHSHRGRRDHKYPLHARLWYKLRYGKNRGIYYGVIWGLLMLFVLPIFERMNPEFIHSILYAILIPSVVIGFYAAYSITMWIDRELSNSYFGVWMRRALSGVLIAVSFALSILCILSFTLTMAIFTFQTGNLHGAVSVMALFCTLVAFFLGVAFFAGYLEYVFEAKSGCLVFIGPQRF